MNRKTLAAVILISGCAFGLPQNDREYFYRRTTTVDPVKDFFNSRRCDLRVASCVEQHECESDNISGLECQSASQVCCTKPSGGGIYFPENFTRSPVTIITRKPPTVEPRTTTTKRTTTTRRTTTTKRTTTSTTTEEPIEEWTPVDCGVQQSTAYDNGDFRDSEKGEFPWNVEIFSKHVNDFGTNQNVFHCGGTLIDDTVVMTAGNCVNPRNASNLYVGAGVWNVEATNERRQIRSVERIIRHPQFEHTTRQSSIALLVLNDPVDFSSTVNRICLPEAQTDFSDSTCFLTGWGGTGEDPSETIRPIMKVLPMELMKHMECQKELRRTRNTFTLQKTFQCAREEMKNHVCPFDVGSPLFCSIPGRSRQFYQVGIFTWNLYVNANLECQSNSNVINLFTKIQVFRNWIDNEMEKLERQISNYIPQPADESFDSDILI